MSGPDFDEKDIFTYLSYMRPAPEKSSHITIEQLQLDWVLYGGVDFQVTFSLKKNKK